MTFAEQLKQAGLKEGHRKGIKKGIEKGLEKGIEKGTVIGQIQQAQRFLGQPVTDLQMLQEKPQGELQMLLQDLEAALTERLK